MPDQFSVKVKFVFDTSQGKREVTKALKQIQSQVDKATGAKAQKQVKGLSNTFSQLGNTIASSAKKFLLWIAAGSIIINSIRLVKDLFNTIRELDDATTRLAIVLGTTQDQLKDFGITANEVAIEMGQLTKTVITATEEFSRAGFSIAESMELAQSAILGANAGFVTLEESSRFIIAGLKAFNLEAEDSTRIIDVLFNVSRNAAINFEGIGDAFLRSANSLNVAGATLEESAAIIAATNESIQDAAKAGTALKTISARLRAVGEEAENFPMLEESLLGIGVAVRSADNSFRDIFSILQDVSSVFGELDDFTKQDILEKLGGKRQANILAGLLSNFSKAEESLVNALESANTAAEANETRLESITGKIMILRAETEKLFTKVLEAETFKFLVEQLTEFVRGLQISVDNVDILIGRLIKLTTVIVALKSTAIAGRLATEGGLLAGLGISAPAIAGVALALGALATIFVGIRTDIEEARIEAEKFTESQIELQKVIAGGNKNELSQQVEKIEELRQKYIDAKQALEDFKQTEEFAIATSGERGKGVSQTAKKLGELKRAIQSVEASLREEGISVKTLENDYTRLNIALKDAEEFEKKLKAIDLAEDRLDQVNSVKQLLLNLEKLNAEEEKTEIINKRIETVTKILKARLSELGITYDSNTEKLGELIDQKFNDIEITRLVAVQTVQAELDALKEKRKIIQNEINLRRKLTSVLMVQSAVAEAMAGMFQPGAPTGAGAGLEELTAILDKYNSMIIEAEKSIGNLSQELVIDLGGALDDTTEKTEKEIDALDELRKTYEDLFNQLEDTVFVTDLFGEALKRTEGEEQITILKGQNEQYRLQQKIVTSLIEAIQEDIRTKDLNAEQTRELEEEVQSLQLTFSGLDTAIHSNLETIKDINKEIEDELIKQLEDLKEQLEDTADVIADKLNKALDDEIDLLKEQKEAVEARFDAEIQRLEDDLELLRKKNDKLDEELRLQEALQAVEDARSRLGVIEKERTVRLFTGEEFEFVADPREVLQAEKDLANAEKNLDDIRIEQERAKAEESIEIEIDKLEKEKQAELDAFDVRIEQLEGFKEQVKESIEAGNVIEEELLNQIIDIVEQSELDSYDIRLVNLKDFVDKYNATLAQINAIPSVGGDREFESLVTTTGETVRVPKLSESEAKKIFEAEKAKVPSLDVGAEAGQLKSDGLILAHKGEMMGRPDQFMNLVRNLMTMPPKLDLNNNGGGATSNKTVFDIGNITLPGVKDAPSFMAGLRTLANNRS